MISNGLWRRAELDDDTVCSQLPSSRDNSDRVRLFFGMAHTMWQGGVKQRFEAIVSEIHCLPSGSNLQFWRQE
jgi:hypothetical protein